MRRGLLAMGLATGLGLLTQAATAAPLQTLSPTDAKLYADAFAAAERGDFTTADQDLSQVSDHCLAGRVQYLELTHQARKPRFEELTAWLKAFSDNPGADRVYALALKHKPAGAEPPVPVAAPAVQSDLGAEGMRALTQSRPAREAYFNGDVVRALNLARASGDAWIAGLAAYRQGDFTLAMASFEALATNTAESDGQRAAGGFWAARAAAMAGLTERVTPYLQMAAQAPDSFYGMIAARKLALADDPLGGLIEAVTRNPDRAVLLSNTVYRRPDAATLQQLVETDPRARRAVALAQLGRTIDASAELRAALARTSDDSERAAWMRLMFQLSPDQPRGEIVLRSAVGSPHATYPIPSLNPTGGFTIDKALVYAVAYQESRFNSIAVSPVGAVGMMQLMPPSAANMAGDATLTSDPMPLFDVGKNLQLGQAYLNWLLDHSADHDILRAVAAYNGGPTTLARTEALLGPDADSLMVVESMPFAETREYVRKVMAAYWAYRRQFGAPSRTLDAAASDAAFIDARLDASSPAQNPQSSAAAARQALEILLPRPGG